MAIDGKGIARLGWRQGAVLDGGLAASARKIAPDTISLNIEDWITVTSHDCDVVNPSVDKEPTIELLRLEPLPTIKPDKQKVGGRNPRSLELVVEHNGTSTVLRCSVHERWQIPRELLSKEAPAWCLESRHSRLIAEWLAKRYIRSAFPNEFDRRWRAEMKSWLKLLRKHSQDIQGVYLRLNTLAELDNRTPYKAAIMIAVPAFRRTGVDWPSRRSELEYAVEKFWSQFDEMIACEDVLVLGTDEITLADIETYQRFDADWVSFADESTSPPSNWDLLE